MKRSLSFAVLILGAAAVALVLWWLARAEPAGEEAGGRPPYVLPVTLGEVERGTIAPRVLLTGSVTSNQRARMGFEVAGRVAEILVQEGQAVEAGAVLARLDAGDQEAALRRAEAAAELAQRELERWLAGAREEEKRRLEAELAEAEAEAELARKEVERGRELAANNVISKSQLDALAAESQAAAARVRSASERLAEARAGTRAEEIEVQRAQVALRLAEVEIARRELEKTTLAAPFAAAVVEKLAALGDSVAAGAPVFELVDLERREIELEVPSAYAPRLGEKAMVELTLDEDPDFALRTEIDALVPVADTASRNFRGLVRLAPGEDTGHGLKPGMFVRARLTLRPLEDVLTVPSDALRVTPSGTIVVKAIDAPREEGAGGEGPAAGGHGAAHGPPSAPYLAEWTAVRVLGAEAGRSAVAPLSGALEAGDKVVVIGVDLAFPSAPLLPTGGAGGKARTRAGPDAAAGTH